MSTRSTNEARGGREADWEAVWETARGAWPGVELPLRQFVVHASGRIQVDGTSTGFAHAADLYLAAACLSGDPAALDALERGFLVRIEDQVRRIDASPAFASEVRQQLREHLLVGRRDEHPRLADYAGRGPLGAWLRVAVVRLALNLVAMQKSAREQELDERLLQASDANDPELELLHARYGPMLRQAIRTALTELTSRQRNLLRLNLGVGLSTAKIAVAYRVDQSTVVRWLQAARAAVRDATYEHLCAELGASTREVQRLTGLLLSRLDLSLSAILRNDG
jgi:RNA polymerase sigma-70 factor (ECF subfamily)